MTRTRNVSLSKRNIKVRGLSPPPLRLSNGSRLQCCRCGAGFEPQVEMGLFTVALESEYLPLCEACGNELPEGDVTLLIAASDCDNDRALKERMRQVLLLRQGRITGFE